MKESMNFSPKEVVSKGRETKEKFRQNNLSLGGNSGQQLENIIQKAEYDLESLLEVNKDWIKVQQEKVSKILAGFSEDKVHEAFMQGLKMFIMKHYRLGTHAQPKGKKEIPDSLASPEAVRKVIFAYTFDFIQSLKQSKKNSIPPQQALELAEFSYHHNPDAFKKLKEKYPDVGEEVLKRALLGTPMKPEQFIENYQNQLVDLIKNYPQIATDVLEYAAREYIGKAKTFINEYLIRLGSLNKNYPSLDPWLIEHVARNYPEKSTEFIEKYISFVADLTKKYSLIDKGVIKQAVFANPLDPENYIVRYSNIIKKLVEKYPHVRASIIKKAARRNPNEPEKYILDYLQGLYAKDDLED